MTLLALGLLGLRTGDGLGVGIKQAVFRQKNRGNDEGAAMNNEHSHGFGGEFRPKVGYWNRSEAQRGRLVDCQAEYRPLARLKTQGFIKLVKLARSEDDNPSLPTKSTNWPKIPNDYHIGKLDQIWLRRANSSPGRKVLLGQLRRFGSLQLTWSLAHGHVVGKFCFFMGFAEQLMGKPSKYRGLDSFFPYSWWFLANPMQCKKPGWNWEMTICRSVYWVF